MVQDFVTTEEVSGRGRRILRRIRVPIFAPNGQVEYLLVLADDITDAQKLADSMRLASKVFETTADGIVMSDADDRVISVNAAFSRLTGLRPEDIVGQLLFDLRPSGQTIWSHTSYARSILSATASFRQR